MARQSIVILLSCCLPLSPPLPGYHRNSLWTTQSNTARSDSPNRLEDSSLTQYTRFVPRQTPVASVTSMDRHTKQCSAQLPPPVLSRHNTTKDKLGFHSQVPFRHFCLLSTFLRHNCFITCSLRSTSALHRLYMLTTPLANHTQQTPVANCSNRTPPSSLCFNGLYLPPFAKMDSTLVRGMRQTLNLAKLNSPPPSPRPNQ
jgi:hypothetical protein